jgi:hypothetical protein
MTDTICVEKVRELLKLWEDGLLVAGEFDCRIDDLFLVPFFEAMERGGEYIRFGSCCCSSHPPDRSFKVEFTIQPHGFTAKRCEPPSGERPVLKIARLRELRAIAAGQVPRREHVTAAELTEVLDVLEAQSEEYQQWICELGGPTPREMIESVEKLVAVLDEQASASLREYGVADRATEHRAEGARSALRAMRSRVAAHPPALRGDLRGDLDAAIERADALIEKVEEDLFDERRL